MYRYLTKIISKIENLLNMIKAFNLKCEKLLCIFSFKNN